MLFEEIKNIKSTPRDWRKFGWTVGIFLIVLGLILLIKKSNAFAVLIVFGLLLVMVGWIFPRALKPVQKVWMALALVLNWFMTRIILSIVFYLVFTPIGLISKLARKEFLDLKWREPRQTYWNYRQPESVDKTRYERQF